jgi:PncC family amidohydrolase
VQQALAKGVTIGCAESLTGGMIGAALTAVPGSSEVFLGGVISYTNDVKRDVLGVPQALLDEHGAVSAPVAQAMAEGVRRITGADFAVSVTGVAGPDRDDRGNEVGTVYLAVSTAQNTDVSLFRFDGDRPAIRSAAADTAFSLLLRQLNENQPTD